jgi:hypothetical protein
MRTSFIASIRKKKDRFFTLLIIFVFISGCLKVNTKSSNSIPDPDEGVKNFVDALNQKDATKYYNLLSQEDRANVSFDDVYNLLHEGPGPIIINYTVSDRKIKGNKTWFHIRFIEELPDAYGIIKPTPYNLTMAFILEDNQWKLSKI